METRRVSRAIHDAARTLLPDAELRQKQALGIALQEDATIAPRAIQPRLPNAALHFWIAGTLSATGVNVAQELEVPVAARLVRISARVKTAPSGGNLDLRLTRNGTTVDSVTVQSGQLAGVSGLNQLVDAGDVLRLDITQARGANATVSVRYAPITD